MPRGIKIGFASTDWSRTMTAVDGPVPGGSNWVRMQQNRQYLGYHNVTGLLTHHPQKGLGIRDWKGEAHYDCAVIVMQRLMFADLVDRLSGPRNTVIVNDIDDWYWGLHPDNHAYKLTHPDYNKDENIEHYKKIVQLSDAVTVSTPFLYDRMSEDFGCNNVHIIENGVDTHRFKQRMNNYKKPVVGWVGSTSHRSGDLELLHGMFDPRLFKVHHSGHVHGAVSFAQRVGLPEDRVRKAPMYDPRDYARLSFEFDIGLAPLNDVPFNHAKSWIKAIEYCAAGVPFVASDVAEYRRLHDTYGIGRLAKTQDEWLSHLEDLRSLPLRVEEAKRQSAIVREHLDARIMAEQWTKFLSQFI